ncbi:hypothetical protein FRC18_011969 [Serendipita sp. 400]|nr:hypothetical protein FRC18_011969 [Serendipita sp. 400]
MLLVVAARNLGLTKAPATIHEVTMAIETIMDMRVVEGDEVALGVVVEEMKGGEAEADFVAGVVTMMVPQEDAIHPIGVTHLGVLVLEALEVGEEEEGGLDLPHGVYIVHHLVKAIALLHHTAGADLVAETAIGPLSDHQGLVLPLVDGETSMEKGAPSHGHALRRFRHVIVAVARHPYPRCR